MEKYDDLLETIERVNALVTTAIEGAASLLKDVDAVSVPDDDTYDYGTLVDKASGVSSNLYQTLAKTVELKQRALKLMRRAQSRKPHMDPEEPVF